MRVILVLAPSSSTVPSASMSLPAVAVWTLPWTRVAALAPAEEDAVTEAGEGVEVRADGAPAPPHAVAATTKTTTMGRIT